MRGVRVGRAIGVTVVIAGWVFAAAGRAGAKPVGSADGGGCRASAAVTFLSTPRRPAPGAPLRVLAVTASPREATLTIEDADGRVVAKSADRHGVTPSWWIVETTAADDRGARVRLGDACETLAPARARPSAASGAWPIEREWSGGLELVYAAWIERLFDDPLEAQPSWKSLDPILGDPARNLLHDHLGLDEDDRGFQLEPDCADLPYFLRAYFAWKLGLPFGYSSCSRGGGGGAPRCSAWHSSRDALAGAPAEEVARVGRFIRQEVAWTIQSGSARTAGNDERGDLYPTRLAADAIRPGTVYADPYGHTLLVVQRLPQTADRGGVLLAVDAQPDGTIARKRFWRGNFLFAVDPALGGAGFKHFRPVVRADGGFRPLGNEAIARDPEYGDFSLEQYAGDVDAFYDRMDDLLSPTPMDPVRVLRETIEALDEQVRTRVTSVANGEEYVAAHPGTIDMPSGAAIFETSGAWEDYATPSRDLRLLIAIDVVRDFPARVARRPERYAMPAETPVAAVRAALEGVIRDETAARRFGYVRSDGSERSVTLAELMDRAEGLEVAYNPNDCVEIRWGALADSDEASTCRRDAPRDQRARMDDYRAWFRERRRPPRD